MALSLIDIDKYDIDDTAFNLKYLMDGILERIVVIFESYGAPLPARKYWTMTEPAIDCEQLVVFFQQAYLGTPGDEANEPQRCTLPRSAVVNIMISRPIPVIGPSGQVPEASKIQKASEIVAVDAWILLQSLNLLDQWEEDGMYGPGVIATVTAGEVSGGFQSSSMQVTMMVP
jgi:hypothetical protein